LSINTQTNLSETGADDEEEKNQLIVNQPTHDVTSGGTGEAVVSTTDEVNTEEKH